MLPKIAFLKNRQHGAGAGSCGQEHRKSMDSIRESAPGMVENDVKWNRKSMDSIRESAPKVVQNDVKWDRKSMDSIRESTPEVVRNDVKWKPEIDGSYSG